MEMVTKIPENNVEILHGCVV